MLACFSLSAFSACSNAVKIDVIENKIVYTVGDNLDVFDLFTYEKDQTYTFSYTFRDNTVDVEGETIYLSKRGDYVINATATKGLASKSATAKIKVVDALATTTVKNADIVVDFEESMSLRALIGRASLQVSVKADYSTYVESVTINKSETESISYDLVKTPPTPGVDDSIEYNTTPDGFFNGRVFTFIYECDYVFTIATITTGGVVTEKINVTAVENFSNVTKFDGLDFNKDNLTVTWQSVEGADKYRVKVGNRSKYVTDTTCSIADLLSKADFQFFTLAVVPETTAQEKLGVYLIEDVIIAPEGSENVVLSSGATVNPSTKEVRLIGGQVYSVGYQTGVTLLDNSHMAFYGDYGVGTYVEFTFKGNNLPQVCFFADEINGDMTEYGGKGYMIMNGLYTPNKGSSSSSSQIVGENRLIVLGPDRLSKAHMNYLNVSEGQSTYLMSENTLFTQKALENDETGRTYRYVVGSFNLGGLLAFEATLYDEDSGDEVAYAVYKTMTEVESAPKGHIIAYAVVKGNNNDTYFKYDKLPYVDSAKLRGDAYNVISSTESGGVTTVELKGAYPTNGIGWFSGVHSTLNNSYVSFKNVYGVSTYVDFTFKGNNMPQVCLFANKVNSDMSCGAETADGAPQYTGYLLMNGLYGKWDNKMAVKYGDRLTCLGPNRMDNNSHYVLSWEPFYKLTVSSNQ